MYNVDRIIKMTFEEQFPNDPFLHFGYQANPENRSNKDSDISNWNSTSAKEIESGSEKAGWAKFFKIKFFLRKIKSRLGLGNRQTAFKGLFTVQDFKCAIKLGFFFKLNPSNCNID